MTKTITAGAGADAIAAYAQHVAQENFSANQNAAVDDVHHLKQAKQEAKAELKALKARHESRRRDFADEDGGLDDAPICGAFFGLFEQTQSDVAEEMQTISLQQQKVSVEIDKAQKAIGEVQQDMKDYHEEVNSAQQGFQEMLQLVNDMALATIKL